FESCRVRHSLRRSGVEATGSLLGMFLKRQSFSVSAIVSVADSPSGILRPPYHAASDVPGRRPSEDATSPKSRSPACEPEARSSEVLLSLPDHFLGYCRGTSAARARPNPSDERFASHQEIPALQQMSSVGAQVLPGRRQLVR